MQQMEMEFVSVKETEVKNQFKKTDDNYLICCEQRMILADDHGTAS